MTLILKPPGRGRWRAVTLTVVDDHKKRIPALLIRPGQRVFLGGIDWRIAEVRAA